MSKRFLAFPFILITLLTLIMMQMTTGFALGEGATSSPWPSWRHDLLNTAAAPDSGYPTTNPPPLLWKIDRSDRPDIPGMPAAAGGPVVVDKGMVFTTGKGIVEAVDQFTGKLIWSESFTTQLTA